MAECDKLEVEQTAIILANTSNTDSVATAQVAVESRLWSVVLVEHLDGRVGRGRATERLCLTSV